MGKVNQVKKKTDSIDKRLFTIPEAGVYLGRSAAGVRSLIYRGELGRGVQNGARGKIWLLREDLDSWINERVRDLAFDKAPRERDKKGRFSRNV